MKVIWFFKAMEIVSAPGMPDGFLKRAFVLQILVWFSGFNLVL